MNADSPPITASLEFDLGEKASKLRRTAGKLPPTDPRGAGILVGDNDPALRRLLSISKSARRARAIARTFTNLCRAIEF
jgi:hypothetical protein